MSLKVAYGFLFHPGKLLAKSNTLVLDSLAAQFNFLARSSARKCV